MEPNALSGYQKEVPEENSASDRQSKVLTPGEHITVIAYGALIRELRRPGDSKEKGISVELIDQALLAYRQDTNSASAADRQGLVVTESLRAMVQRGTDIRDHEEAFLSLEAPRG
jgi:pyruvate/2-oxoglutarate/acetoin dehydrogenase E1 component